MKQAALKVSQEMTSHAIESNFKFKYFCVFLQIKLVVISY